MKLKTQRTIAHPGSPQPKIKPPSATRALLLNPPTQAEVLDGDGPATPQRSRKLTHRWRAPTLKFSPRKRGQGRAAVFAARRSSVPLTPCRGEYARESLCVRHFRAHSHDD
jgi:hypothetical protein